MIVRSLGRGARAGIIVSAALALLVLFAPPPADASSRGMAAAGGNSVQLLEVNSADANNVQVVFRYDGDEKGGKAIVTPVTIGASDMTHTEITSGLKDDQKIDDLIAFLKQFDADGKKKE